MPDSIDSALGRLAGYVLAGGFAVVPAPESWTLEDDLYIELRFGLPDGGRMEVSAIVYDIPDAFESNDFTVLFADLTSDDHLDAMRPRLATWAAQPDPPAVTIGFRREADDGVLYRHAWRMVELRPPRLARVVTWSFEPAATAEGAPLAAFADKVHEIVHETEFAEEATDLDRVPVSHSIKLIPFGGTVLMRAPVAWKHKRQHPDGTGRHLIDEPVHDRWTLWVDWDEYRGTGARPLAPPSPADLAARLKGGHRTLAVPHHGDTVIAEEHDVEDKDGEPIRVTAWHRFAARGGSVILAHFSFVVTAEAADLPEIAEVRAFVEREAMNAILVPGAGRPFGDAGGG